MWANDFRVGSQAPHFCALAPMPMVALRTGRLCQYTPSGSGTRPSSFLLNLVTTAPYRPVISAFGIRVVLMCAPRGLASTSRHQPSAECDTCRPDFCRPLVLGCP